MELLYLCFWAKKMLPIVPDHTHLLESPLYHFQLSGRFQTFGHSFTGTRVLGDGPNALETEILPVTFLGPITQQLKSAILIIYLSLAFESRIFLRHTVGFNLRLVQLLNILRKDYCFFFTAVLHSACQCTLEVSLLLGL